MLNDIYTCSARWSGTIEKRLLGEDIHQDIQKEIICSNRGNATEKLKEGRSWTISRVGPTWLRREEIFVMMAGGEDRWRELPARWGEEECCREMYERERERCREKDEHKSKARIKTTWGGRKLWVRQSSLDPEKRLRRELDVYLAGDDQCHVMDTVLHIPRPPDENPRPR